MQWPENYCPVTFVSLKVKLSWRVVFFPIDTKTVEEYGHLFHFSVHACDHCMSWRECIYSGRHMSILEGTCPSRRAPTHPTLVFRLSKSQSLSCWQPTTHSCLMQATYQFHVSNPIFVKRLRIFFAVLHNRKKKKVFYFSIISNFVIKSIQWLPQDI